MLDSITFCVWRPAPSHLCLRPFGQLPEPETGQHEIDAEDELGVYIAVREHLRDFHQTGWRLILAGYEGLG
jgi:hypothetical protein